MQNLKEFVKNGKAKEAEARTMELLAQNVDAEKIMSEALIPAMDEVGDLFQKGEYFVPEMLVAARAMKQAMNVLRPIFKEKGVQSLGKVVMGTVKGDLHDIGKNLVCMMLEGAGYQVLDLGVNVEPVKFVDAVVTGKADAIGMSALLTTTMTSMKTTIDAFKEAGVREKVKIMVGGAPLTQNFADEIGADGYAPDAASAVDLMKSLVK